MHPIAADYHTEIPGVKACREMVVGYFEFLKPVGWQITERRETRALAMAGPDNSRSPRSKRS
jgi:hypothetical protein